MLRLPHGRALAGGGGGGKSGSANFGAGAGARAGRLAVLPFLRNSSSVSNTSGKYAAIGSITPWPPFVAISLDRRPFAPRAGVANVLDRARHFDRRLDRPPVGGFHCSIVSEQFGHDHYRIAGRAARDLFFFERVKVRYRTGAIFPLYAATDLGPLRSLARYRSRY